MWRGLVRYFLIIIFFLVGYVGLMLLLHQLFVVSTFKTKLLGFLLVAGILLPFPLIKFYSYEKKYKEERQMFEKLQKANLELNSLREMGIILNSTLDLEVILNRSLKAIESNLSFAGCTIWAAHPRKCHLSLSAAIGAEALPLPDQLSGKLNLIQRVFQQRDPLFLEGGEEILTPSERDFFQKNEINSLMLYPIFDDHLPLGLIALFNYQKMQFDEENKAFLKVFIHAIALAIRNAWLYKRVYQQSIHDELTGLYNHRYLMERLGEEVERAHRLKNPLSLLIFDFDDFKVFNDTFGHLEGNRILAQFGSLLKSRVRSIDIAARFGGEEFVVVLPETELTTAVSIAERIQAAIRNDNQLQDSSRQMRISCSVGGASLSGGTQTAAQLLNKADAMLYKAKQQKDCIVA